MDLRYIVICLFIGNISLHAQEDTISIEAVNVEAYHVSRQLRTIPGSLSVITPEGLQLYDRTGINTLNNIPGVTMQSGTYTTNRIIIRGMGSRTPYNTNRIRTYLNDIPLTTSDGLSSPEEIDVTAIGRLEIIKGPSSALYGSGLGGNINLYTPVANENKLEAGIQYGSFNTIKPSVNGSFTKGRHTLWAALNHLHSDGWRENSNYDRTSLILNTSYNRQNWKTDLLLLVLGVNSGIPSSLGMTLFETSPESAAANWKAIEGYKKYSRMLAGITITGRFANTSTAKISLFARGIDNYERRPFNNLDDQSLSGGIRGKLNIHGNKTDLVFGSEWVVEQYDWKLDTANHKINENREIRNHLNLFGMIYYQPVSKFNISFAAALNYVHYRLNDRFPANGDKSSGRKFPLIFSPRIGLNYLVRPNLALYASAGHGFSLPSPEETLLPEGDVNPGIRHENGWQCEAGTRYSLSDRFFMDLTLYWIELNNLLVTKRITEDIFTGINAGRTRHKGIELQIHSNLNRSETFPGEIKADASFTWSANTFVTFADEGIEYDGNRLPGIPENVVYVKLTWDPLKYAGMLTDLRYTGSQYLNDANSADIKGYTIVNLKVYGNIPFTSGTLSVYAGINNIFDVNYASMLLVNARGFGGSEPRYYYPGLPANYYAGISYRF